MHVGSWEAQHDLYAILGLSSGASPAEIRRAYRRLAWRYHPDRDRGTTDVARMKRINLAARVLLDVAQRARYDDLRKRTSRSVPRGYEQTSAVRTPAEVRRPRGARGRAQAGVRRAHGGTDAFSRRLAGFAILMTLLVAFTTEQMRAASLALGPTKQASAVVYAADYPPVPVRYALATALALPEADISLSGH